MVKITVRGQSNYSRYTIYSWILEIKDILESELGEEIIVEIVDDVNEDPEILVNGISVGMGLPGEEGYLIEILKRAIYGSGIV